MKKIKGKEIVMEEIPEVGGSHPLASHQTPFTRERRENFERALKIHQSTILLKEPSISLYRKSKRPISNPGCW